MNSIEPQSRGFDVFEVDHPLLAKGTVELSRLNPQLHEPFGRGKGGRPPKRREATPLSSPRE